MIKKLIIILLSSSFVGLSLSMALYFNEPPALMEEKTIVIKPGQSASSIGTLLKNKNLVRSSRFFSLLSRLPGSGILKSGTYTVYAGLTSYQVYNRLTSGAIDAARVTIPEGYNLYAMAKLMGKKGICAEKKFIHYAFNRKFIASLGITAPSMEGYLFPDTYHFRKKSDPRDVMKTMHMNMLKNLQRIGVTSRGRELTELLTLASLIESEAKIKGEQPIISSVFHNRLNRGMKLDCDPTVRYAVKRFTGAIWYRDLKSRSPYNTYVHRGLPPGPISAPGRGALRAALEPAETRYLYFVARDDGSHYFSTHLAEHNRAVEFYQRGKDNGFIDRQKRYR